MSLEGERTVRDFINTPFNEGMAAFSPAGNWLAYQSDESGRMEVHVVPYPNADTKQQISIDGGGKPTWTSDGALLYQRGNEIMSVPIDYSGGFVPGEASIVGQVSLVGNTLQRHYDAGPDGAGILVPLLAPDAKPARPIVVENWFQELTERVPVN